MDTLQIFARFLFNLPLCHSMWQALWPNHQMLLWPEIHTERTGHDRADGQSEYWEQQAQWTASCERVACCKMQNAEETKKIAITIWHRRKTCEEKNLWNVSVFVFLVFVHCKKIQIKRKMCKLLWMVCHSNLCFAMTSHTLWGKNCMLTACRVSASRATHLPI